MARLTYQGTVYPWHCDHVGHMNVMWYVGKFDEATWHLLASIQLTPAYLREQGRGMVAVEHRVRYQRELLAGDLITIYSQLLEVRPKVVRFQHRMVNTVTGDLASVSTLTGVHIDIATRRSTPMPDVVLDAGRAMLVESEDEW